MCRIILLNWRVLTCVGVSRPRAQNGLKGLCSTPRLYPSATPLWRKFLVVACPWPSQRTRGRIWRASARVGRGAEVPDTLGNRVSGGAVSVESFGARERAFASPFVIFAQLGIFVGARSL